MTREEAKNIMRANSTQSMRSDKDIDNALDIWEALGIIKFDEDKPKPIVSPEEIHSILMHLSEKGFYVTDSGVKFTELYPLVSHIATALKEFKKKQAQKPIDTFERNHAISIARTISSTSDEFIDSLRRGGYKIVPTDSE